MRALVVGLATQQRNNEQVRGILCEVISGSDDVLGTQPVPSKDHLGSNVKLLIEHFSNTYWSKGGNQDAMCLPPVLKVG